MSRVTPPRTAIMAGELGLPVDDLDPEEIAYIESALTFEKKAWDKDEPPTEVAGYTYDGDGMIWLPRCFEPHRFVDRIAEWRWAEGEPHRFNITAQLDPERGQVTAVPRTVEHLLQHHSGILVAPTGTGKTLQGLVVAAHMGRFIGWPVYASHMEDNVREHAHLIGLTPDDIGVVRGKKCDLGKPLTIMYIPSLLRNRYPDALYQQIGTIVADEVNRMAAPEWKRTVGQFSARYRLGMSADPTRKDGLNGLITTAFGSIAHESPRIRSEDVKPPTVVQFAWDRDYPSRQFCRWKKNSEGEWEQGDPHPTKYDQLIAADVERNRMLATEIRLALTTGRKLICFSRFVEHLEVVMKLVLEPDPIVDRCGVVNGETHDFTAGMLIGKTKKRDRQAVIDSDALFTTFAMARDAFNDPKRDTGVFLTPPGDPLQPLGRLREKIEWLDRRPLLWLDPFELPGYSFGRAEWRRAKYSGLKIPVVEKARSPENYKMPETSR